MPITVLCTKSAGNFKTGQLYNALKKTYVPGYDLSDGEDECFIGWHMSDDLKVHFREGAAEFELAEGATHD